MKSKSSLAGCALAILGLAIGNAFAGTITTPNTTNFTTSTAEIDSALTLPVASFSSELIVNFQGAQISDTTYPVSALDPTFLADIGAAQTLLAADGSTSIIGPTLDLSLWTESHQFVGPDTFLVGSIGLCTGFALDASGRPSLSGCAAGDTMLALTAGQTDFDTLLLSVPDVSTFADDSNGDALAQVFEIDGVVASVPEPASWALMILGLVCLGFAAQRRRAAT